MMASFGLHSLWVHPKYTWPRNDVSSSISTLFSISSTLEPNSVSFQFFSDERTYIPSPEFCPVQVLLKLARNVFPIAIWPRDGHANFVQKVPQNLQISSMILAIRGRRIQTSRHCDFAILSNLGASSNFTWVKADTESAVCPSQNGNLAITSMIFAAVICDADEPCS